MSYLYGGLIQSNKRKEPEDDDFTYNDDEEDERNDIAPDDLDPIFCDNVHKLKWHTYQNIVFKPELETPQAQDNTLIKKYVNTIRKMYILTLNAQKGHNKNVDLKEFPNEVREEIQNLLDWIADFFSKNELYQTIPYSDYLMISFQVYPFIQKKSFNNESFVDTE